MPPLSIAFQMNAIESLKRQTDSSLFLAQAAQRRGHTLYYYQPHQLSIYNGKVIAPLTPFYLDPDNEPFYTLGPSQVTDLNTMNVILMRQDPPFDMTYLTYTYYLECLNQSVRVLNNPKEVRNSPEKLFTLKFKDFMPPTLISTSLDEIRAFFREHTSIILKPLYAFAGQDICHLTSEKMLEKECNNLINKYNLPIIAQKFLPNIKKGDKRIILVDGEVAGALNRIPQEGQIVSNIARGGTAEKTTLTEREQAICNALKSELKKRGLMLVGIDVIDGYLTEINTTSPTGLVIIENLYGLNIADIFWNKVEAMI